MQIIVYGMFGRLYHPFQRTNLGPVFEESLLNATCSSRFASLLSSGTTLVKKYRWKKYRWMGTWHEWWGGTLRVRGRGQLKGMIRLKDARVHPVNLLVKKLQYRRGQYVSHNQGS